MTTRASIQVAAGIIRNEQGRILLSLRPPEVNQGGLWEFPGGKIEPGESVEQALTRELHEELGIRARSFQSCIQVHHDYPEYSVHLCFLEVTRWTGEARSVEGQQLRWCVLDDIPSMSLPEADLPVVQFLLETNLGNSAH